MNIYIVKCIETCQKCLSSLFNRNTGKIKILTNFSAVKNTGLEKLHTKSVDNKKSSDCRSDVFSGYISRVKTV